MRTTPAVSGTSDFAHVSMTGLPSTGNGGLDLFADAIAERVLARLQQGAGKRLLNVSEAATYLGRSVKSMRGLIAEGRVPSVREGTRIFLCKEDLDRWIEMRRARG